MDEPSERMSPNLTTKGGDRMDAKTFFTAVVAEFLGGKAKVDENGEPIVVLEPDADSRTVVWHRSDNSAVESSADNQDV